jgi:hypothetical protein
MFDLIFTIETKGTTTPLWVCHVWRDVRSQGRYPAGEPLRI